MSVFARSPSDNQVAAFIASDMQQFVDRDPHLTPYGIRISDVRIARRSGDEYRGTATAVTVQHPAGRTISFVVTHGRRDPNYHCHIWWFGALDT